MAKEDEDGKKAAKEDAPEEGEEKEGEEGLSPPPKKFGKKKLLIIGGAVLVLLLGGGAGLYFSGILGGEKTAALEGEPSGEHGEDVKQESGKKDQEEPVFLSLGDILVNLRGDGKRPNFLKIKVSLELADKKDLAAIEALKPRIIDNFQIYLRELRVEDLRGSAGLYRLREELLLRVSEAVAPMRVRDVLFQEMLVQ